MDGILVPNRPPGEWRVCLIRRARRRLESGGGTLLAVAGHGRRARGRRLALPPGGRLGRADALPEAAERVPPRSLDREEGAGPLPRPRCVRGRPAHDRDRPGAGRGAGAARGRAPRRGVRHHDRPRRPGRVPRRTARHRPRLRPGARRAAQRRLRRRLPDRRPSRASSPRSGKGTARDLLANLVWCGKESALKVLRTGLRRDTRSVEVSFPEGGAVDGWAPMSVRAVEGTVFPGWWQRFGAFVADRGRDGALRPAPAAPRPARPRHRRARPLLAVRAVLRRSLDARRSGLPTLRAALSPRGARCPIVRCSSVCVVPRAESRRRRSSSPSRGSRARPVRSTPRTSAGSASSGSSATRGKSPRSCLRSRGRATGTCSCSTPESRRTCGPSSA